MAEPPTIGHQSSWVLTLALAWLPILTPVVGAVWAVYLLTEQQKSEVRTRFIEARKPFLEYQLKIFLETSELTAKMITMTPREPDWKNDYAHFRKLNWQLSLVGDQSMPAPLMDFYGALKICDEQSCVSEAPYLESAHERLAKAFRASIERTWGDLPSQPLNH